jgi:hypothetical protein
VILILQIGKNFSGPVAGSIVHTDHLHFERHVQNTLHHAPQRAALVVNGHYNGQFHVRKTGSQFTSKCFFKSFSTMCRFLLTKSSVHTNVNNFGIRYFQFADFHGGAVRTQVQTTVLCSIWRIAASDVNFLRSEEYCGRPKRLSVLSSRVWLM